MSGEEERCCGKCKYHKYYETQDWDDDGWVCTNPYSDCYGEYTKYGYCCDDFEERSCEG